MTLKVRFSLSLISFSMIVLMLFGGAYFILEKRGIRKAHEEKQRTAGEKLASVCQWIRLAQSPVIAVNYIQVVKKDPAVLFAACLDSAGRVQAHSDPERIARPWDDAGAPLEKNIVAVARQQLGRQTRWLHPVEVGGARVGLAILAYDSDLLQREMEATVRSLFRQLLFVAGGTFVLAVLLSLALAWNLSRPIGRLVEASRAIGEGRLDYRTEISRRSDELGVLAQEMNSMAGRLKELDNFKDSFINAVSHDLRTPLGAMQMWAETLRSGRFGALSAQQLKAIGILQEGSNRLQALVSNILDSAKLKAGRFELSTRPVDVQELIDSVVLIFQMSAEFKEIRLSRQVPPNLPKADIDADGISRVLANLVSNAIKYSPSEREIIVAARESGAFIEVSVTDQGAGLSAADQAKLFQPFERLSKSENGHTKGAGLGLVIVKKIIEAHGGTVTLNSQKGSGSTFSFTIPKSHG